MGAAIVPLSDLWKGGRKAPGQLTLQKTFKAEGDIADAGPDGLTLRFRYPDVRYKKDSDEGGTPIRQVLGEKTIEMVQALGSSEYEVALPGSAASGAEPASELEFIYYLNRYVSANNHTGPLETTIGVDFYGDDDQKLAAGDDLPAIFFLKNFYNSFYEYSPPYIMQYLNGADAAQLAGEFVARNGFLVNADVFKELLVRVQAGNDPSIHLLHILAFLTDLSSGKPALRTDLTEDEQASIDYMITNTTFINAAAVVDLLKGYFDRLFDFPISTEAIKVQEVAGSISITGVPAGVTLTAADFSLYDIALDYQTLDEDGDPVLEEIHYDWTDVKPDITDNRVSFSLSAGHLIMPASAHEEMTVTVRTLDGMVLWSKDFHAGSAALKALRIAVPMQSNPALRGNDRGVVVNAKRLRGQILDMTKSATLLNALVVIQAKHTGDAHWHTVGSALSDKDGYFSLPYPYGVYTAAHAVLSLNRDAPVTIGVHAATPDNQTIADDFLFLMLREVKAFPPADGATPKDDCDCHDTLKATRLPDQADLIHSDEYTQDLGAGCINLSTPNRTLREYSYTAVVRTSDPDVASYTLVKNLTDSSYSLQGEGKKRKRKAIDLTNPIRWQDAPDKTDIAATTTTTVAAVAATDDPDSDTPAVSTDPNESGHTNLSFYQAVTVATGHILHYKSQFKADGYSLGELLYSLPLAPGQKKQIVVFDSSHALQGTESQQLSVSERLANTLVNDRSIADQLGGSISEGLHGSSSATTAGISAAAGASGSAGAFGASLGVAGGWSNSNSDASQDSSRNISQFFAEKLRNSLMQNADSYRQQNASVVTTVTEGQKYAATTEVVANHNHCHSLTMMYFEVLKHYAIYQELSNVEECVFVPLLLTNFTPQNVFKWRDVLAANLLPLPSNTYLPSVDGQHPLARAFDANERKLTGYRNVDFPKDRFADDTVVNIKGGLNIRVNLPRPRSRYDRIMSFPLITKKEGGPSFWDVIKNALVAPFTAGIPVFGTEEKTIEVRAQIFDSFMKLDANYESVPPAECIRVVNFYPVPTSDALRGFGVTRPNFSGSDFFDGNDLDRQAWEAYATIMGMNVYAFLTHYFANRLISEWDTIFYNDIVPVLFEKIVHGLSFSGSDEAGNPKPGFLGTFTLLGHYNGGERIMGVNVYGKTGLHRADMPEKLVLQGSFAVKKLLSLITLQLESLSLTYSTAHFSGPLYNGYLGQDIETGAMIDIPLTEADKRDPRKEDTFIVGRLIDHLNSSLEYYNKVLWYNLDTDRRYMLLEGFNIQVYNDHGVPIGLKSLASVIKNELVTVAGNSLVFPVASGFRVSRSYLIEQTETGGVEKVTLLDHYKPVTPAPPFRLSVPTKGLFVEAVKGLCDSCEKVEPDTSQDWDKFKADEPTAINALTAPTPEVTDWKATFKDIASATLRLQDAPAAPDPGAGLKGLSDALTKSDTFRDVTGLAKNQDNAIATYKANTDAAVKMAESAKSLASQEHNTAKSPQITQAIKDAATSGTINKDDASKLTKQHLSQLIDGGETARTEAKADALKVKGAKPSLTDAAITASPSKNVKAQRTDPDGTTETVEINGAGTGEGGDTTATEPVIAEVTGSVPLMKQPNPQGCWATTATMMMSWKTNMLLKPEEVLAAAGNYYLQKFTGTPPEGLFPPEKVAFISRLGMVSEPLANNTLAFYVELMKDYGPLWVTMDANTDKGLFSPHARVLTKITGNGKADGTFFYFNDPGNASSQKRLPFLEFIQGYEQALTDNDNKMPFSQVVHFKEKHLWYKSMFADNSGGTGGDSGTGTDGGGTDGGTVKGEAGTGEGFAVLGPWNVKSPEHETMTMAGLLDSDLTTNAAIGGDLESNEVMRGVLWNDDPANLFFNDGSDNPGNNWKFSYGAKWTYYFYKGNWWSSRDMQNITGRSHFGDLQFLHGMASIVGEDPHETRAKILMWAEFTYRVAISADPTTEGGINLGTLLKDVPVKTTFDDKTFTLGAFFNDSSDPKGDQSVRQLFVRTSYYASPNVPRRALGSLLHMIQDSYAKSHTKRMISNLDEPRTTKRGLPIYGVRDELGAIQVFYTAKGENAPALGLFDHDGSAAMDPKKPDSFDPIYGARDAVDAGNKIIRYWKSKTPYDQGPKDLLENTIFQLAPKVTWADNLVNE